ncbi:kinase-like domain-containing protein [Podospora didyma]|uniref:Kinase-like domain-containing protein n=1 Tax=Podospora didyma TaxID=330526 RepID=A0AAE0K5P3_9PEZI|nr:kinase-like domain-containing protein [Podospora didyma]
MSMSSRPPPIFKLSSSSLSGTLDLDDLGDGHASFSPTAAAIAAARLYNHRNAQANSAVELITPTTAVPEPVTSPSSTATTPLLSSQIQFRSHTIAPSPPPPLERFSSEDSQNNNPIQSQLQQDHDLDHAHTHTPALRLRTDIPTSPVATDTSSNALTTPKRVSKRPSLILQQNTSASSLCPVSRTPSLKTGSLSGAFGSHSAASSTVGSPVISAMGDVTPLPSPLLSSDSPGPWKQLRRRTSRDTPFQPSSAEHTTAMSAQIQLAPTTAPSKKKGYYAGLSSDPGSDPGPRPAAARGGKQDDDHTRTGATHTRNRSISDYKPDPMLIPKRMVTVSGSHLRTDINDTAVGSESHMRREPNLSEARGLTPIDKPPTPPPSESSITANEGSNSSANGLTSTSTPTPLRHEYFEAYGRHDRKKRRWRSVKMLGQGTFSRVMLATSQISSLVPEDEDYPTNNGIQTPEPLPPFERRTLVAVKVCEHGPRGGASEDRIEMSLKRELEIMQSISHPSLVHLKAWNIEPTRAILMLSYCPGGDLFDLASGHRDVLSPGLLRRMFAEMVGAVRYLHDMNIVHRDIKLENVLVNLPPSELQSSSVDWATYPYSVITLTDLGLSRRVAENEKLETRCGSDDYAAPEVIMGQPYDGRATDAWSLGVLLYALLEARLPFDPHPNVGDHAMQMRMRSRTSHRIARVEWRWIEYGVRDGEEGEGEHEADISKFESRGLRGAMEAVESLLKRAQSRWPLSRVAETEWVRGAIQVEGGIKFREEEEGEEVL